MTFHQENDEESHMNHSPASRSRLKSAVVVLICASVLSVVGVSSASAALPELVNKSGSELIYGFFTQTAGPGVELEGANAAIGYRTAVCASSSAIGVMTGTKTSKLTITYNECSSGKVKCHTKGQLLGTIKTLPLLAKLVYLNEAHTSVGWALEPATKNGLFVEVDCGGVNRSVSVKEAEKGGNDTLLAHFSAPYNTKVTELPFELGCFEGIQTYKAYYEGALKLSGYLEAEVTLPEPRTWENYCVRWKSTTGSVKFEEEVELKA
jgi:hypothetical protein